MAGGAVASAEEAGGSPDALAGWCETLAIEKNERKSERKQCKEMEEAMHPFLLVRNAAALVGREGSKEHSRDRSHCSRQKEQRHPPRRRGSPTAGGGLKKHARKEKEKQRRTHRDDGGGAHQRRK
jgi:hypothetical protein